MASASLEERTKATDVAPKTKRTDVHETFKGTKVFSALNGIRCLCAIGVIKVHAGWTNSVLTVFNHGDLGVDMFFAISGFLIVTLLLRERDAQGDINLKKFYARRTLRIFPAYYALILLVLFAFLVVAPWKPNGLKFYLPIAAVLLTYTTDIIRVPALGIFNHCWSLAMEEQFYLAWPAIERSVSASMKWVILALVLVLNQLLNFGVFKDLIVRLYGHADAWKMPVFLITFTPIVLGVILAHLLHHRRTFVALYRVVGYPWSPFVFFLAIVGFVSSLGQTYQGLPRLILHLLLLLGLASVVVREDHWARAILTFSPIARLGMISYGIYLYHASILDLMKRITHGALSPRSLFFVVTMVTVAVAELSFRFFETRFLLLRRKFGVSRDPSLSIASRGEI